jgi:hypothetical protein
VVVAAPPGWPQAEELRGRSARIAELEQQNDRLDTVLKARPCRRGLTARLFFAVSVSVSVSIQ